jgi:hypothetical protein
MFGRSERASNAKLERFETIFLPFHFPFASLLLPFHFPLILGMAHKGGWTMLRPLAVDVFPEEGYMLRIVFDNG